MKVIEKDVVIVGAGPAGLAAAVELTRKGLHIAIVEKSTKTGGSREGGIGPFAVESTVQQIQRVDLTKEAAFEYMMEFTHWTTDARLVSEFINMSADTIAWLQDMGIKFTSAGAYYTGGKETQHNFDHMKKKITEVLEDEVRKSDCAFFFQTAAKALLQEHGRICGVVCQDSSEEFTIRANAVVLAAGGFAGDTQLVREAGYEKGKDLFYTFEMPNMNGDGLRMAWNAGAQKAPMMMDTYVGLTKGYGGPMGTAPALAAFRHKCNLVVNQKGWRFMREDLFDNPGYTGSAVHHQYQGCAVSILDEALYHQYTEEEKLVPVLPPEATDSSGPREPEPFERFKGPMPEIIAEAIREGVQDFFIADSLEELAQKAGIPYENLKETLDEYNAACAEKEDVIFHKHRKYLKPITGPRFYAARLFCDTYGGLGGLKINHRAQVLDEQDDPIPGLYAAGNDANTIYGGCYPFYLCGNTSSFALNTGRMAGKDITRRFGGTTV